MAAKRYDEILAKILWDPSVGRDEWIIVYEDRRAPQGLSVALASDVDPACSGRRCFVLVDGKLIPMHLLREIRNLRTGQTVAGQRVELPPGLLSCAVPPEDEEEGTQEHLDVQGMQDTPAFSRIEVAVRASYPETVNGTPWPQVIAAYRDVGAVEVAFHRAEPFLDAVNLGDVVEPIERNGVRASSVHMAHARLAERESFVAVLKKTLRVAQALNCQIVVAHPSHGQLRQFHDFIVREVSPLLEKAQVILCWETFSGARRFLTGIEGIAKLCRRNPYHRACYDTSHLHKPQAEVLEDVRDHAGLIRCFHLSNRRSGHGTASQHLPLLHPEGELDFQALLLAIANSGFAGSVTLEYLKQYHDQLASDALWVKDQLGQIRS